MNSDIRLHIEFWSHAKTRRMIRVLGLQGPVSLQILWCYVAKNRPDGILAKMDATDIEDAAGWPHDRAGEFFQYLTKNRWLDRHGRGVWAIHEWYEYNPWVAEVGERIEDGKRGAHERHHVQKRRVRPEKCAYCRRAIEAGEEWCRGLVAPLSKSHSRANAPSAPAPTPAPGPAPSPSPAPVAEERERAIATARAREARAEEVARWLESNKALKCLHCDDAPHIRTCAECGCSETDATIRREFEGAFEARFQFRWNTWCVRRAEMEAEVHA